MLLESTLPDVNTEVTHSFKTLLSIHIIYRLMTSKCVSPAHSPPSSCLILPTLSLLLPNDITHAPNELWTGPTLNLLLPPPHFVPSITIHTTAEGKTQNGSLPLLTPQILSITSQSIRGKYCPFSCYTRPQTHSLFSIFSSTILVQTITSCA